MGGTLRYFNFKQSVAERISYVWRVNYFDCCYRHVFSTNDDDESHSARMAFSDTSNSVKACQTTSSSKTFEQDGRISVRSVPSSNIIHHKESCLVHGPLSLPF